MRSNFFLHFSLVKDNSNMVTVLFCVCLWLIHSDCDECLSRYEKHSVVLKVKSDDYLSNDYIVKELFESGWGESI